MTLGGYFGCGWFRDFWRLPEYVKDANNDKDYLERLTTNMRKNDKPPSTFVRLCGMIIVGDVFGYLVLAAIPTELFSETVLTYLYALLVPLGVSLGVYTVGNIGRYECDYYYTLIGAYFTAPLYFFNKYSVFWTAISSIVIYNKYGKKWQRSVKPPKPFLKRLLILFCCAMLYFSLWSSWFYFNCYIQQDDEEIKCRDAAKNVFRSPAFQEFRQFLSDLKTYINIHGWSGIWKEIIDAFDPQGEKNALRILNLTSIATQEEITSRYRQLSRQWHPDKHKDPAMKLQAQEFFIEVQQSYEILSRIKSQRLIKNSKGVENPSRHQSES